jgi:predicted kinase/transcriptional regulator with XRE-family HTH domain
MAEPATVTEARRQLGAQLAAARVAAGYSQTELARKINYGRSSVASAEIGHQCCSGDFWAAADKALAAGGALEAAGRRLAELRDAAKESEIAARRGRTLTAPPRPARDLLLDLDEDATDVIRQAFEAVASHLDGPQERGVPAPELERRVLDAHRRAHQGADDLTLVLVGGYAGSGKTEFARFLSALTGWAILDKDTLTRPLVEQLLAAHGLDPNDRHSETYLDRVRPHEYRGLLDAGCENLKAGVSTVLTAPFVREFSDPWWFARVQNKCKAAGATLVVIWMSCDLESMYDYISYRGAARDSWKLANWGTYSGAVDEDFEPAGPHYVVDNRLNAAVALADQARDITGRMRAQKAGAR